MADRYRNRTFACRPAGTSVLPGMATIRRLAIGICIRRSSRFLLTQRSDNGQGAAFEEKGGASLVVWGEDLATGDFRAKIGAQMATDERNGWHLTYRRLTPRWASYSGIKGDKIRYFRAVALCADRMAGISA